LPPYQFSQLKAFSVSTSFHGSPEPMMVAGKLTVYSQEEVFLQELIIEGLQCLQMNEAPALALRKLSSFAEAHQRSSLQTGAASDRRAAAAAEQRRAA